MAIHRVRCPSVLFCADETGAADSTGGTEAVRCKSATLRQTRLRSLWRRDGGLRHDDALLPRQPLAPTTWRTLRIPWVSWWKLEWRISWVSRRITRAEISQSGHNVRQLMRFYYGDSDNGDQFPALPVTITPRPSTAARAFWGLQPASCLGNQRWRREQSL